MGWFKSQVKNAISSVNRKTESVRCVAGQAEVISLDPLVLVGGMSRSGTTLLALVLDSHPDISSGAELMPSPIPSLAEALLTIESSFSQTGGDFSKVGRTIRQEGNRELGLFLVRCFRAGLTYDEVFDALTKLKELLPDGVKTLGQRLLVAQTIMRYRADREGTPSYGFKFTSSAVDAAQAYFPNCTSICIVRDPRDVVLSHQKRGFDRTVEEVSKTWLAYAKKFRQHAEKYPGRCIVIRYEDLTRQPRRTLMRIFDLLPVNLQPEVFEFYNSDSPIHAGFHPNAERLRMNFSTDGIGLGLGKLPRNALEEIEAICNEEMLSFGYDNKWLIKRNEAKSSKKVNISSGERKKRFASFKKKRKFNQNDYANLLEPFRKDYEILSISDYVRETEIGDRKVLMIRHDVDHDLENALIIARWEAERGIRATYCLLHTAWYYGELDGNRYRHSDMLVDAIVGLSELGHEINLHNNLVTLALTDGVDPIELLKSELDFYDSLGVPISGTSTHGDALCRELNFRNWELFKECCDERFGGPRTLEKVANGRVMQCALGEQSMFDLGLEYEAYDIGKDVYHTESGGNMRTRDDTKGRRSFGRMDSSRGSVCGILTHPVWWSFN